MATLVVFSDAGGDGDVQKTDANWDTCHDAASGDAVETGTLPFVNTSKFGSSFRIQRAFFPFDTADLPDNAIVSSALLRLYIFGKLNDDNDGDDWVNVVQTTQSDPTNLVLGDYSKCGSINDPDEGATRIDIGNITSSAYNTWTLNSAGIGWLNKTGFTKLGMREGHDAIDSPYGGADSSNNYIWFVSANQSGTNFDPRLTIAWTDVSFTNSAVGKITRTTATVTSNLFYASNLPILEMGVVVSTGANPTIDNEKFVIDNKTGDFEVKLKNLTPGTKHFARTFLTNTDGTTYG